METAKLPIMEQFYTIQGEGAHQGKAAYFIRLGGCDVGCVWCDVKESWDANAHPLLSVEEILKDVLQYPQSIAVITGGEPVMHNLDDLCATLQKNRIRTHLETSGSHPLSGAWDWICFSPKKFKAPLPEYYDKANELKIIVYNKHDLKWAESFAAQVNGDCHLFLQPEWGKEDQMLPLIIDYVKANPKWRISLQVHKYINVP